MTQPMKQLLILFLIAGSLFVGRNGFATSTETGCPITVAFGQHCERLLINRVHEAHKEIQAAIYEFTKSDIADAFIERAEHGVKVTIKVDAHEAEYKFTEALIARMLKAKIEIQRIKMPGEAKMHDKFIIIDGRCVLTGSYNWTKRATDENWENLVAIESTTVAEQFSAEWERIKNGR